MKSKATLKKVQLFAACVLGGTMLATGCTMRDLRDNLVAGTLSYVEDSAATFWAGVFPVDAWVDGLAE